MKFGKVAGLAFVMAIVFGIAGVIACNASTNTPKFCGLMFYQTAPIGFVVGVVAGLIVISREKK